MSIINPLPYIFQNGTTADATQVDADFAQIVSNVNTNVPALIPTFTPPNIQIFLTGTAQTYTTPLNVGGQLPLFLEVEMVGGGGGGGEGGAAGNGVAGIASTFGTLAANGGQPGTNGGSG